MPPPRRWPQQRAHSLTWLASMLAVGHQHTMHTPGVLPKSSSSCFEDTGQRSVAEKATTGWSSVVVFHRARQLVVAAGVWHYGVKNELRGEYAWRSDELTSPTLFILSQSSTPSDSVDHTTPVFACFGGGIRLPCLPPFGVLSLHQHRHQQQHHQ